MKKFTLFVLLFCLLTLAALPVSATGRGARLVDQADLLTDSEEKLITEKLDEISERQQYDIVIMTVDSIGNKYPELYAADAYEAGGYGFGEDISGTLLLVSMEYRDWAVVSTGEGEEILPDPSYISDDFIEHLSDGDYYRAFDVFADEMDDRIDAERNFPFLFNLVISLGIGLVAALVVTLLMKGKLKSVKSRNHAREYVREGSFALTRQRDLYLYSTVNRVPRPKNNTNGGGFSSSSGRSFRGGSGKF